MNSHFLQSHDWQKYQQIDHHKTFRLDTPNSSILAVLQETSFCKYLFCPYGPSSTTTDSLKTDLKALKDLANKEKALFIRIEPTFPFSSSQITEISKSLHLKSQKSHDIDPAHTWKLDLTPPEPELLSAMETNKVRLWRNHQKKDIIIRSSKNPDDIRILESLLKTVGNTAHFTPQTEDHLRNQLISDFSTLYIAELASSKTPIAATLVYDSPDTRFYAHSASDYEHRKLTAGSIILIQSILDAKNKGLKFYDFWGITTSTDKNHPWYGFTQYKKSFGGFEVNYAGTYDIILHPTKYRTYQILRHLNRLTRKVLK